MSEQVERPVTCWVNFVSEEKWKGKEEVYRTYALPGYTIEGEVVYVKDNGEAKVGKKTFPSQIFIVKNGENQYGFNFPVGSYYYWYVTDGRMPKAGDKVKITYLGTAKDVLKNSDLPDGANVVVIQTTF